MGDEKIQIVATATDRASPALKTLKANVAALGTARTGPMGGMIGGFVGSAVGAIGMGLAIGGATKLLMGGIEGALAEEKQLGRLDTALKNNVKGWDGNRDAVDKYVQSAMDLSFSDDDARESMISLVTAMGNVKDAQKGTTLAMNIARGRNIDLATATQIVIKANMGNVGALRRMGIELDKGATKTEILAELQRRYAGQAITYADTVGGSFEKAQVKVDDAMEGIGHTVIEVAADMMSIGERTGPFIDKLLGLAPVIAQDFTQDLASHIASERAEFVAPAKIAAQTFGAAFVQSKTVAQMAKEFGDNFTDDLAGSLRGNKDVVKDAMDAVMWAMKHPMKLTREAARIEGALTTLEYKRGLASGNPMLVAIIDQQMGILKEQWTALTGTAYQKGVNAADALERGLRTFNPPKMSVFGSVDYERGVRGNRASGGDVAPGQTVMVGERGPELITAGRRGANVTANHNLGTGPIHVVSAEELARILDQRQGRMLALSPSSSYSRG